MGVSTVRSSDPVALFSSARAGDRSALARLLSMVERGGPEARAVSALSHPLSGSAVTVGITGAPGAGKSTLTSALIGCIRAADEPVAVLAIDPSSPFTGGAILGDRVRMSEHSLDTDVFIRSMATRGHLGGLSLAVPEASRLLDAVGMPWVLVETVGVGQVEVEIAGEADTTVVVVNPGWGDAVQANKAGLMEIADIFVVNKADRPGVQDTIGDIERMLSLRTRDGWRPPIITTVATTGDGVEGLWQAMRDHGEWSVESGQRVSRRAKRLETELRRMLEVRLLERITDLSSGDRWTAALSAAASGQSDPWDAIDDLLS
ncbi:ArgK Putative periplasmic protein kinase ArgK and related GTPases of G3E family [Acidimicrobiia bacterium]